MIEYRLFQLSESGAITRPAIILVAADDAGAIAQAEARLSNNRMELWRGAVKLKEWNLQEGG